METTLIKKCYQKQFSTCQVVPFLFPTKGDKELQGNLQNENSYVRAEYYELL